MRITLLLIALFFTINPLAPSLISPSIALAQTKPCSVAVSVQSDGNVRVAVTILDKNDVNGIQGIQPAVIHPTEIVNLIADSSPILNADNTVTRYFITEPKPTKDLSEYLLQVNYPTPGSTGVVSCDGATDFGTGETDVDLGGGTTDGPAAPPISTPTPVPCSDKTGADKTSCVKKLACETEANRDKGKVFARAFNNACVTLPEFIQTLVNYVMMFAAIIAGFMFLQGGLKIVASRGNPAAIVEARSTLLNAAVGLVLLATSYVIIQFLSGSFGYGVSTDINLLGPFVP